MSRFLMRVAAVLARADSKKFTDRKTLLQDMLDIYADEEFVAAINDVSENCFNGPTSWNEIMNTIHRIIITEAERPGNKAQRSKVAMSLQSTCCAVMLKTVSLATSTPTMSLDCANLIAMTIQILENKIYETSQDTYISILVNHVLMNRLYRSEITGNQWLEILRLSKKIYQYCSVSKSIALDCARLAVQYGCLHSHLLLEVKQMLPFLEKIYEEIGSGKEMMLKPVYKLTYVVCQQIGTESRIALCEFSEKCLPHIVTLEGCPDKYDMMLLLVKIHHPGGVSTIDDAAYASNLDLWKNIIRGIHANIIRDIRTEKLSPCFLKLACEVYRQIMQDSSYAMNGSTNWPEEDTQPQKRRRLSMAIQKPIDMLIDSNIDITWPFIQICTVLLRKYPNSLKSDDYVEFLKSVTDFVKESLNKENILDSLCELCTVLVENEKEHFVNDDQTDSIGVCWEKIWDTVLSTLSMNQNEVLGHKLLQSIIEHRDVVNPTSFLRHYLKNAIRWSPPSIKTLLKFCNYVPIPSELSSSGCTSARPEALVREELVRWAMGIPSSKTFVEIPNLSLANLLTKLVIKSSFKPEFRDVENFHELPNQRKIAAIETLERDLFTDREAKIFEDIERSHLALEFRTNLLDKSEESTTTKPKVRTLYVPEVLETLTVSLTKSLSQPLTEKNCCVFIKTIAVVAKLLSNFVEFYVSDDTYRLNHQHTKLITLFNETFKKMSSFVINIDAVKCVYLVHIVEALESLYCTRYHWKVYKMIVELTTINLIEFIYDLIPEDNDEEGPRDDGLSQSLYVRPRKFVNQNVTSNDLSESCRIKNGAHKILAYYCCTWIGEDMSIAQTRVLKNVMKIDIYHSTSTADLRRALTILKLFGLSENQLVTSDESLDRSTTFLKNLYDSRKRDETAVRGISNVLPHFVKAALHLRRNVDHLVSIACAIHKQISSETPVFGPLVQADFLRCLTEIIRLDPHIKWQLRSSAEPSPITDVLLSYGTNPFYSVRLEVIRAVYVVFSSKDLDVPWKLKYFKKIKIAMANLFVVDARLSESEKIDELLTRTRSALHVYAKIIQANEFLQSRALFGAIEMSVERDVKTTTLKKALLSTTRNDVEQRRLIETNLHYLISRWFEATHPLEKFPWTLAECKSLEAFSKKYIGTLLTIKLERQEFEHVKILCNNLDVSFETTIENSFPSIIALLLSMSVDDASHESYAREMYERLRSNSAEFKRVRNFDDLLQEKLADVIVNLVIRLHDQQHFFTLFELRVFLPKLNPPNFNVETIRRCLHRLENDLPVDNKSLIEYLVTCKPNVLQRVLLTLICNVHEVNGADYKLQAFHQYAYFYSGIIEVLSKSYFDSMSLYIVRDVSHSLLALIKDEAKPLSDVACTYFTLFLRNSLPSRSNEIKEILSFTVSSLIPIIQTGEVPGAMSILHFLIIEQKRILSDEIEKLDSFPNEPSFEAIKEVHNSLKYKGNKVYSLDDEIEHFLNAIHEKTLSCSLEGLSHVRNQLSTRKNELRDMYSKLERLRGFAEDCAQSTLHRLIYKLVQLTRSSNVHISLEAAKCLGELGPADLSTMILHPENGYRLETISEQKTLLTLKDVSLLADYLIESNVELKKASSDALYAIFSRTWGQKLTQESGSEHHSRAFDYLYPFIAKNTSKHKEIVINRENWTRYVYSDNDLWTPASHISYSTWIVNMSCKLLDCLGTVYATSLKRVCQLSVEFCESLLPRLINLIRRSDHHLVKNVDEVINRFFCSLYESINETDQSMIVSDSPIKRDVPRSYECVRCMLNVVNFMRIQAINYGPLASADLDYLMIAKAAQYCSAYFTSVLYAELWCERLLRDTNLLMDKVPNSWISPIDCICEYNPANGKFLQDIVREAYLHIGDPDAIYGCGMSHLVYSSNRIQHYIHLRQWDKVMLAHDVDMTCGNTDSRGMLNALQQSGLQYLLGRTISTVNKDLENVDDFMYETAWRLSDWSIVDHHRVVDGSTDASVNSSSIKSADYYVAHYRALKCLSERDIAGLKNAVDNGRASVVKSLRNISLECSQTVYPILSQLQLLREIEEFAAIKIDDYNELFNAWDERNFNNTHDFQYVEPILSQRLVMYRTRTAGIGNATINRELIRTHLDISKMAEKQGYFPLASRSLDTLAKSNDLSSSARDQLTYREAVLAWKRKDQDIGRFLLRNLIKKSSMDPSLRAKSLRVYGNWMAETKSENPRAVKEKYYEESIRTSCNINNRSSYDNKNLTDAQADLAQFADAQYQQIIEFMKSSQYDSLVECARLQNETRGVKLPAGRDTDEMKAIHTNQKQMNKDVEELEEIKREKQMWFVLAARYYLKTLQYSDRHDLLIFRFVSLWLDDMRNKDLNEVVEDSLQRVASYKFITLLPQLAPHMSIVLNEFTSKINDLMERCATEHPHHTLPVLFALKNTSKDQEFQSEKGSQRRKDKTQAEPRVVAADALISKLTSSSIRPIIQEMSQLSSALIMLAYYTVPDAKANKPGVSHNIPKNQAITRIRNYEHINVPTITLDVRPNRKYDHVIGIKEYRMSFEIPGGLCAPKKVICVGTDGIPRKQLVKGRDDLRQDAVMQQVCTVMNSMLKASKETKRRKLHIRTYKIVPLSQRSGVLEWCENTLPISSVLCGSVDTPGLHAKYYPEDWSVTKCRGKMREVHSASVEEKRKAFLLCCENLHPAFHHFFMEKYPSAETWFERRLAYTRSVATTSMVGYMLGLGDRHFSNILIDQSTAEVIHIDFGIAFAQGKVLAIPETVPFRLTRDMEVAMGICGVEGVMRRSCEETVTVLRDRRKILITLLQVLLYDPLFSWKITPVKCEESYIGARYGGRTTEETNPQKTNKIAERALLRIEQKLQGTEDGLVSSIPGQVERLIQQARDPSNLCRLFSGWQAYL